MHIAMCLCITKTKEIPVKSFSVMCLNFTSKTYNKWYIDSYKEKWKKNLSEDKFRMYRRKQNFNHGFDSYMDTDATFLGNGAFVLCNVSIS